MVMRRGGHIVPPNDPKRLRRERIRAENNEMWDQLVKEGFTPTPEVSMTPAEEVAATYPKSLYVDDEGTLRVRRRDIGPERIAERHGKQPITRSEITRILDRAKFTLKRVNFEDLARGGAYFLKLVDPPRQLVTYYHPLSHIQAAYTYNGLPIICSQLKEIR